MSRSRPGQRVVIQGPSGSGKTTLFRVLAGLWPFGRGHGPHSRRAPRSCSCRRSPTCPIGTLREALCYPDKPETHSDAEIGEALSCLRARPLRRPPGRERQLVDGAVARRAAAAVLRPRAAGQARLAVPRRGELGARRGDGGRHVRPAGRAAARASPWSASRTSPASCVPRPAGRAGPGRPARSPSRRSSRLSRRRAGRRTGSGSSPRAR